ncbi:hypothetical protein PYW07_011240 [Mythimna separata]|uniref:PDZ domain-containing protein n=1 Tax=Mythimna separata TaxID=271217 RepID=A0AAD7Y7R8_MYTSE|nr:hypothetical protein PYW07_011240 [Mythimna separata]
MNTADYAGKRRGLDPERAGAGCDVSPGSAAVSAPSLAPRALLTLLCTSREPTTTAWNVSSCVSLAAILDASAAIRCVLESEAALAPLLPPAAPPPRRSRPSHLSLTSAGVRGAGRAAGGGFAQAARAARGRGRQSLAGRDAERASLELRIMSANGSAATEPRLCHVRKTPDFDGYGFNLHAEKGKPGQYIGKVDDGSPAEAAGLRRGDRILEVNGHSIAGESHKQVVARIKERADDAELLVAAPAPGEPVPELDAPPDAPDAPASPAEPPRLNLRMTAAEMRAHLAAKKKIDPKKVPMDLKSKFDIVKKL